MANNTSSFARAKGAKKRPYKRKLENGPKRPLSAYNLFFKAERLKLCEGITINKQTTKNGKRAHRKSHGAVNFSDMGKRIAAAWKALDEAGRAPYVAEAALDLKRYQQAKEEALQQQAAAVAKSPHTHVVNDEVPQSKNQNMQMAQTNVAQAATNMTQKNKATAPPPHPATNDESLPPSTTDTSTTITQDYAYQCEVCHTAIFPSYDECLKHEQECAKNKESKRQNETEAALV